MALSEERARSDEEINTDEFLNMGLIFSCFANSGTYRSIQKKVAFFWFSKKGFPEGELGLLMALALEMKIEGLESVIRPLKRD